MTQGIIDAAATLVAPVADSFWIAFGSLLLRAGLLEAMESVMEFLMEFLMELLRFPISGLAFGPFRVRSEWFFPAGLRNGSPRLQLREKMDFG